MLESFLHSDWIRRDTSYLSVFSPNAGKTPIQVFSCQYCEIFKNTYFEEHLQMAVSDKNQLKFYRKTCWKKQPFIFCLSAESPFPSVPFHMWQRNVKKWIDCVNIWKRTEAAKLLFQEILVLRGCLQVSKVKFTPAWDFKAACNFFRLHAEATIRRRSVKKN